MHIPLYLKDYADLDDSHVDYTTKNVSFIRTYSVLKQMGIVNNKFHLLLLDTSLRDIDPYNLRDNSMELKLRIIRECKLNPWYFFRSVVRVPAAGTIGIPFILNRANLCLIWLFMNHVDNLLIIPRQTGKTISTTAIVACVMYVMGQNINFSMLTKDAKLRKENVDRLKDVRDLFPTWFISKQRGDIDSREEVSYEVLANKYQTYVAQSSISGAERLGRGMTTPSQHWDEIGYFPNIDTTYPIALSTTTAAIESAKKANQPHGNILTTTAGKLNTKEGLFTHGLITSSMLFSEKLYDSIDDVELNAVIKANSPRGMIYSEFSYKQLGKTEEWFEASAARLANKDVVKRDLLNIWTFGTQESPVDLDILERLYMGRSEPSYIQKIDEFMIRWYIPKTVVLSAAFSDIPIVIGMDASSNVGRDFTSLVFVDARNMRPVATCSCNSTNIIKIALFICKWLRYSNIGLIPEANHVGRAIIDYCLLELAKLGINPFEKIFNGLVQDWEMWVKEKKLTKMDIAKGSNVSNAYRKEFGFNTTSQTRPFLYQTVFKKAMEVGASTIADITLINQISGLTVRNGRIDHAIGGNDDSVVAYLLACNWLLFGNNLDMYQFTTGRMDLILSEIKVMNEDGELKEAVDPAVYLELKLKIDQLEKTIKSETNSTIKIEKIHKLNALKKELPPEDENVLADIQSLTQLKAKRLTVPMDDRNNASGYIVNYLGGFGGSDVYNAWN